ncbi:Bacterial extracellular solute-binding protein, family 3 [compost metagenome]
MGLEDAEVFVARKENGSDPRYFDNLRGKRLALFNGYHYAFASFNADPDYLRKTYNATLTYSHDSNLLMVQAGRADIALVTRSYLSDFLDRNPGSQAQLVASQRIDQVYHHYALLRPGAPIGEQSFAALMRALRENGELTRIFQPYRITVQAPRD